MKKCVVLGSMFLASLFLTLGAHDAKAIPSFAAQTNQPCSSCHIGAFGPQLKPYGMDFKLYGYVTSDRPKDNTEDDWRERMSMMVQSSFTNTKHSYNPGIDGYGSNNNFSLDQVAVYYGGRITSSVGGIAEFTFDPPNNNLTWDAMDIRHAWEGELFGEDYVGGVVLSNQIGNTSLWNSTPPNTFPYNSSRVAPTPAAGNLFDDTLNSQVVGPGAYISWNDWLFAEGTVYFPMSHNFDQAVGARLADYYVSPIPFWHLALQHQFDHHQHYAQIGTFGAVADRYLNSRKSGGFNPDHVTDIGFEGTYEYLADMHNTLSFHTAFITEYSDLSTSHSLGNSDRNSDELREFKADATYSIEDTYVPSVGYFKTLGTTDATFWSLGTGASTPDSEGYTVDLAYVPFGKPGSPGYNWGNMRMALEYTGYTQFDGSSHHADANNTLFLNFWFILDPLMPIIPPRSTPN